MNFWVDMDNAPHVHVLRPIILELERRGHHVEITARDYGQTIPLLEMYGLKYRRFGRHPGKNSLLKRLSFLMRSLLLIRFAVGGRFGAIFCHGARAVFPAARLFRIPLIVLGDYEYASLPRFMCRWMRLLLTPDVIPADVLVQRGVPMDRIHGYPGLKEDLYVHAFEPDPSFLQTMKIERDKVLVLVRPPATMAHYAVAESEILFFEVLDYLCSRTDVQILLLPRTNKQGEELKASVARRKCRNIHFPAAVYNGPNLIWHSDLVVSGGGTMNREAASLGIPVVSIYQGPIGGVDRHLIDTGRLLHVRSLAEMESIPLKKFDRKAAVRRREVGVRVRDYLVNRILEAAERDGGDRCS
jgi:predicted glycosyltransferase